ncbi:hypothetical protein QYF61_010915 [Mycteria americana]|uniref:Uncharacterized protein n=1 Tax=Mycteria americana TaxID=33587 RepID=A0AAN7S332_MYCAM|nr:hypothetical protein QYF61_010915 [Mycteria americana]
MSYGDREEEAARRTLEDRISYVLLEGASCIVVWEKRERVATFSNEISVIAPLAKDEALSQREMFSQPQHVRHTQCSEGKNDSSCAKACNSDKKQWAQIQIQEIQLKHKKFYYCESDQRLDQSAQRPYGISIFGDIQNATGHGRGQPAVVGPALSRGIGLGTGIDTWKKRLQLLG